MAIAISLSTSWLEAARVTLAWDANTEPNVAGYRIHYGPGASSFSTVHDVGNLTAATVLNLEEGQSYSFYVTCYNTAGLESEPSNVVSYIVPVGGGGVELGDVQLTGQGLEMRWTSEPGTTYRILSKDDLSETTWRILDEVQAGGSSLYWVDGSAAEVSRRFYRIEVLP